MRVWSRLRWVLAALALPFAVLGLIALAGRVADRVRFDAAYFVEPYVGRYDTPEAAVKAMESALRRGNLELLAELEGMNRLARFKTSPGMAFVELWERRGPYSVYLFLDRQTYMRYLIPFEQVSGRWVASPRDLRYFLRSGHWREFFLAIAGGWWAACAIGGGLAWLGRRSARPRW